MKALPYAMGLMLAGGFGTVGMNVQPHLSTTTNTEGLNAHETHASASLLGQFRTNVSSWLWLRTDLYLHNGVEMRPLTEAEKRAGKAGVGNGEAGQDALHDDSNIVTTVPSKDHDFRGVLGDLDRAVNAYKDMKGHTHNDPNRALPLFRLMTWIDPSFIPGWTVGATVLARNKGTGVDRGIAMLQEGLSHNPTSATLLGELGRFYAAKKHDFPAALKYLRRAIEGAKDPATMTETERDGLREAFRWACLASRESNDLHGMRRYAAYGLQYFPDDPLLQRSVANIPAILTPKGEAAYLEKILDAVKESAHDHDHDHDHDHEHDHGDHDH